MAAATFDTLKYANTLKAASVPEKQAEAQASVQAEALAVNFKELATKEDLAQLRVEWKSDLRETEQRLNARIDNLATQVEGQIALLRWMIGLAISLNAAVLILFIIRVP